MECIFWSPQNHTYFLDFTQGVDAQMCAIFVDFSKKKSLKEIHSLTAVGNKILILSYYSKITDVSSGCKDSDLWMPRHSLIACFNYIIQLHTSLLILSTNEFVTSSVWIFCWNILNTVMYCITWETTLL